MARTPQILDRWGRPLRRAELRQELARASTSGVRRPQTGYPGDGLDPVRLATILREADAGDPVRYLELAETIEERNEHYLGVLGTRKRSVSQLDITVEPGGDTAFDRDRAAEVEDWLGRDELSDELVDILDAVGKGYSFHEIVWERSAGEWRPQRLEYRDPRWFRFDRVDLRTPLMLGDDGQELPLPAFKFVFARLSAKSGLPLRSGLARVATWNWMFKAYTQRDWAIFTQTYGQPLRLGKWGAGASEDDKDTLFRAVSEIAGDCAAIIPETMSIDFVETGNLAAGADLYLQRADWLDRQVSKAVLGQTATTDAIAGGHAVGREHRSVQEDIERADAKALAGILNRDLIQPWMQLNHGRLQRYPRIKIGRPEQEDLQLLTQAVPALVGVGARIGEAEVLAKFGLSQPTPDERILGAPEPRDPSEAPMGAGAPGRAPRNTRFETHLKGSVAPTRNFTGGDALQSETGPTGPLSEPGVVGLLTDRLADEAAPAMEAMLARVEAMVEAAGSLEELREMIVAGFGALDASALQSVLGRAMVAAMGAGRVEVEVEVEMEGDNGA
jgi:phage gp29-like protein